MPVTPSSLRHPSGTESVPPIRAGLLALFVALSALTLGLGGWLTVIGLGPWYDALRKPWFQPPGWVFSPAWTIILTLLAVATWQIARRGEAARSALRLYAVQLVLNVAWSLFFFTLARPAWALANIALLDVAMLAMIVLYGRVQRAAGWLLVPYAAWLGLATAINVWIVAHN